LEYINDMLKQDYAKQGYLSQAKPSATQRYA